MKLKTVTLPLFALTFLGCPTVQTPTSFETKSFQVQLQGVYSIDTSGRTPLAVVSKCVLRYGSPSLVPNSVRGTKDCPYLITRGVVEFELTATAVDNANKPVIAFQNPVSFTVNPGDFGDTESDGYRFRWAQAHDGVVTGIVRATHLYGKVMVWAQDKPVEPMVSNGNFVGYQYDSSAGTWVKDSKMNLVPLQKWPNGSTDGLPPIEPQTRSFATGTTAAIYFQEPTLQSIQIPGAADKGSSPFSGEFVTIGSAPESGEPLIQTCDTDPERDGQPSRMVVTGTDPSGFYVTDISACRVTEGSVAASNIRIPEPNEACVDHGGSKQCVISKRSCSTSDECLGYLPGTFGAVFVYNYQFPDGLNQGDLLYTLSGSIQEFTSTTQITFPGWTIGEKVRSLPPDQWNKWLKYVQPVALNNRICGQDISPFLTDSLCGHNVKAMKMESLESALVKLPNVHFPEVFTSCDFNGDGTVPFFCEQAPDGTWFWGKCGGGIEPDPVDQHERECHQNCVVGMGPYDGKLCSELSNFLGFGQFIVELGGPGLASAGLDNSIPGRFETLSFHSTDPHQAATTFTAGQRAWVACDFDAHVQFGDQAPVAVKKNIPMNHRIGDAEGHVSLIPDVQPPAEGGTCSVAASTTARINLITRDALPDVDPTCSETNPNADLAQQCVFLHRATFEVIGHLRQVQPARPRWLVTPRDADDVCCHPADGMSCPRSIKACPTP